MNIDKLKIHEDIKMTFWQINGSTYFVNLPCVVADNKQLHLGENYFLFQGINKHLSLVRLLGLQTKDEYLIISVEDVLSKEFKRLSTILKDDIHNCCFYIVSIDFIVDTIIYHWQSVRMKELFEMG
ncbi:hypothetical protein ES705_07953 [subsurface metagenome]